MRSFLTLSLIALGLVSGITRAAQVPAPSVFDARVRYVDYRKDDVTVVNVRRGVITRIVLEEGEKILSAATGFAADCAQEANEWCVRADKGTNQIWVKPKDGATFNNLELKTDQRDYSIEFHLLRDLTDPVARESQQDEPMFRVMFRYPAPATVAERSVPVPAVTEDELVAERIAVAKPVLRNTRYSIQVMKGGEDIAPSLIFDDGRFTYLRFPSHQEIPTVFFVTPSAEEARVNVEMQGDFLVVQRTGRRFVLRLGKAVVGVWNEAFDPNGLAAVAGTTVSGVERAARAAPTEKGNAP